MLVVALCLVYIALIALSSYSAFQGCKSVLIKSFANVVG